MTELLASTDLYLLFSKGDTIDNIDSGSFVRLGVSLIFSFEDCLIFRAAEAISKQTFFFHIVQLLPCAAAFLPSKVMVINVGRRILAYRVLRMHEECIVAIRTL